MKDPRGRRHGQPVLLAFRLVAVSDTFPKRPVVVFQVQLIYSAADRHEVVATTARAGERVGRHEPMMTAPAGFDREGYNTAQTHDLILLSSQRYDSILGSARCLVKRRV